MAQKAARRSRRAPEVGLGFHWAVLNSILLVGGVIFLVAGYVALSRGSITLAPVLLIIAYCGLIPASLLIRSNKATSGE